MIASIRKSLEQSANHPRYTCDSIPPWSAGPILSDIGIDDTGNTDVCSFRPLFQTDSAGPGPSAWDQAVAESMGRWMKDNEE